MAPIVAENCASCHQDGDIAPFALTDYAHAAPMAAAIAAATTDRTMPPWLADASGACGSYTDATWLSEEAIETLADWAAAEAPPGDETAVVEAPSAMDLEQPYASFDIGADYVPVTAPDDHRCFIVDPGFTTTQFVTDYQVVPGELAIVHHVIVYALGSDDADRFAAELDSRDETPGYPCMGSPNAYPSHSIGSWAPGMPPTHYPDGKGIRVDAGHKLVIELHYHEREGAGADRTVLRLHTVDSVEDEALVLPLADRGMVLPPGERSVATTYTFDVGANGLSSGFFLHGANPHLHLRGRSFQLEVERGGETTCLMDVPRWDFDWQRMYLYRRSTYIAPTDLLRMTCTYDTTGDTEEVLWGEGTGDEMCLLGLLVSGRP